MFKFYLSGVIYSTYFCFLVYTAFIWSNYYISLPLSGTEIKLEMHGDQLSPILLYNMHDNENTSAVAGRIMAAKYGGQYYELIHTGNRNIGFGWGEDSIFIDPNRIYTDAGVWQQLEKNNIDDTLAFYMISDWRDTLLSILRIDERSLVIALHNNTNKFYSVNSYCAGGEYEIDADSAYVGRIQDMDDFYFVTDPYIFETLITGKYHVVLQANETVTDDGSLSVYCGRLGIPYINVEAQHNHLIRQVKMLIFAFQKLVGTKL